MERQNIFDFEVIIWILQYSKAREDFQEFLSVNGHLLGQNCHINLVQLGLSQPDDSIVYKQSICQAKQELKRGALYVNWM